MTDCTTATMEALIENAERTDMVATNIGNVPIEDYREIVATQNGFDSYEEMYNEGVRIGNGYDKKPEPIVPAWEQKRKSQRLRALTSTRIFQCPNDTILTLPIIRLKKSIKKSVFTETMQRLRS